MTTFVENFNERFKELGYDVTVTKAEIADHCDINGADDTCIYYWLQVKNSSPLFSKNFRVTFINCPDWADSLGMQMNTNTIGTLKVVDKLGYPPVDISGRIRN